MKNPLTLNALQLAHDARTQEVSHFRGENTPEYFVLKMNEEVGELTKAFNKLNKAKTYKVYSERIKLESERTGISPSQILETELKAEIADCISTAMLLCNSLGLNAEAIVRNKFNEVSEKLKINTRI